ncbi:MAG TPA: hypothetical protein VMV95_02305 [Bacillota bacterium]|nr:hypothetical protein [Bacillota bacterium]
MIKIKEKTRKILEIIWTGIVFLIFLFFLIKYIKTEQTIMMVGIVIFLILTVTMIIDLYPQIKK